MATRDELLNKIAEFRRTIRDIEDSKAKLYEQTAEADTNAAIGGYGAGILRMVSGGSRIARELMYWSLGGDANKALAPYKKFFGYGDTALSLYDSSADGVDRSLTGMSILGELAPPGDSNPFALGFAAEAVKSLKSYVDGKPEEAVTGVVKSSGKLLDALDRMAGGSGSPWSGAIESAGVIGDGKIEIDRGFNNLSDMLDQQFANKMNRDWALRAMDKSQKRLESLLAEHERQVQSVGGVSTLDAAAQGAISLGNGGNMNDVAGMSAAEAAQQAEQHAHSAAAQEAETQQAATHAASQEVEAQQSASQAQSHEAEAQQAATQAQSHEAEAQQAATQAQSHEAEAQQAATQAQSHEAEAQQAATQAQSHEAEAQQAATQAQSHEAEAQQAATQAQSHEAEAQQSASQAQSHEAEAQQAATQAQSHEAEAQQAAQATASSEQEASHLRDEVNALRSECESLMHQIEELHRDANDLVATIESLQQQAAQSAQDGQHHAEAATASADEAATAAARASMYAG